MSPELAKKLVDIRRDTGLLNDRFRSLFLEHDWRKMREMRNEFDKLHWRCQKYEDALIDISDSLDKIGEPVSRGIAKMCLFMNDADYRKKE